MPRHRPPTPWQEAPERRRPSRESEQGVAGLPVAVGTRDGQCGLSIQPRTTERAGEPKTPSMEPAGEVPFSFWTSRLAVKKGRRAEARSRRRPVDQPRSRSRHQPTLTAGRRLIDRARAAMARTRTEMLDPDLALPDAGPARSSVTVSKLAEKSNTVPCPPHAHTAGFQRRIHATFAVWTARFHFHSSCHAGPWQVHW